MALPKDYTGQKCSMARSLEVVGERWTLLVIRDAFFGVRRFGDFVAHLDIPRAVLSDRLASLVDADVLASVSGAHGHVEYVLTDKGRSLWPVVRSLLVWGDEHYAPSGPNRVFHHHEDGGEVLATGYCAVCGALIDVADLVMAPGPAMRPKATGIDPVSAAISTPHRLLEPIRAA